MNTADEKTALKTDRLCHIYGIGDPEEAAASLEIEGIKGYGEETWIRGEHNIFLHDNYAWDYGSRSLFRCRKCGGMFLSEHSGFTAMNPDNDGHYSDMIPVWSEEEADLLNIVLGPSGLEHLPVRHLCENNRRYCWVGDETPAPPDIEALREQASAYIRAAIERDKAKT